MVRYNIISIRWIMIGYKRELLTLDSTATSFISKKKKRNENSGSTFLLVFLFLINIFHIIPIGSDNTDSTSSSLSISSPSQDVSKIFVNVENHKIKTIRDATTNKIRNDNDNDNDKKKYDAISINNHRNHDTNMINKLSFSTYGREDKEGKEKGKGKEESGVLPIQNRLVHYGVYCGPGPADAFSGWNDIFQFI